MCHSDGIGQHFRIFPIGEVKKQDNATTIQIYKEYQDALLGLHEFSHVIVVYWFHKSDTPEKRKILQVHPRKDLEKPLKGIFATRSPVRPNPIALSVCEIKSIKGNVIYIGEIDAFDGSPVIDLKPYIPQHDSVPEARIPGWVRELTEKNQK